jgi:hypothetical protein
MRWPGYAARMGELGNAKGSYVMRPLEKHRRRGQDNMK